MTIKHNTLIAEIDAILPQTQCGQCGYAGCKPYATAIANGTADINQCPPGDEAGVHALADLLNIKYKPLNKAHGKPKPKAVAFINEAACIGCTLCLQACPVDAILGASKQMHTIIANECTGCELCIAPCPVDCIQLLPVKTKHIRETKHTANIARKRYELRLSRLERQKLERNAKYVQRAQTVQSKTTKIKLTEFTLENKLASEARAKATRQATIAAAIERARTHKNLVANIIHPIKEKT